MPTRTPTRRAAPRAGAGRFGRPLPSQRPPRRPRRQAQKPSGLLATAAGALPLLRGQQKKGRKAGGSASKAKPAMALLAAAGAVLGRRRMQQRRAKDAAPVTPAPPVEPAGAQPPVHSV